MILLSQRGPIRFQGHHVSSLHLTSKTCSFRRLATVTQLTDRTLLVLKLGALVLKLKQLVLKRFHIL